MLKVLGKVFATWLTAFAITGATVWACPVDDAAEADGQAAGKDSPTVTASVRRTPD